MIDPTAAAATFPAFSAPGTATSAEAPKFGAALEAAERAEAAAAARLRELDAIRDKGFGDWVRDTRIAKLKEELRKKVMAGLGVDEDGLSRMDSIVRRIIEQKIQEEVERQLDQVMAKEQDGTNVATDQGTPSPQPGKNDLPGRKVPVIPALVWPGGESIL